ncbi:fumarylacetoacetate hydrolase family protein [Oceanibacterium hippocampi]|uniref:Fumarylpyruvate hydrolase n=1 Tax=Oceanibacterium hippocampi TaxID=745714 RepID=A0A1Y5TVW5_9PROT|nr:fumarylacetoacetate hydrolase family protein [Oceanibacterium hippocampi]SLN74152.1 Fumarylpyruvate hydrolase [Oceanibacterium hippocampi]
MKYAVPAAVRPHVAIARSEQVFPVRRIYCVGRNYAAHAREMGADPDREPPFFFLKPADAVVASGTTVPYPQATENYQHEIELVAAIGKAGHDISAAAALDHVFGYAVGLDMTRRDLQMQAREKGRPWDMGKGFDQSAPCGAIHRISDVGHIGKGAIWVEVNGEKRQVADVSQLIWNVAETIAHLSRMVGLAPGDFIYTGTPEGVSSIGPGDHMVGHVDGLSDLEISIS